MVYWVVDIMMTTIISVHIAERNSGMVKDQLSVPTKDVLVNVQKIG